MGHGRRRPPVHLVVNCYSIVLVVMNLSMCPLRYVMIAAYLAMVSSVLADPPADPSWWSTGTPPVKDPSAIPNNHGAANIGQAKFMAKRALDALRAQLPDVADQVQADLVGAGKPISTFVIPALPNAAWQEQQRMPLLIGQLKAISAPFYDYLNATAPEWLLVERQKNGTALAGTYMPWTSTTTDDNNHGMATVGQLKAVFALRFENLTSFSIDSDGDGLLDGWEMYWFGNLTAQSGNGDADGDGILNRFEMLYGLNPTVHDANQDSDQDGMNNLNEQAAGTNPTSQDHPLVSLSVMEIGN